MHNAAIMYVWSYVLPEEARLVAEREAQEKRERQRLEQEEQERLELKVTPSSTSQQSK